MCDYNQESKKALTALTVQPSHAVATMSDRARRPLIRTLDSGRARAGHDLMSGKALQAGEVARGHYMTAGNFDRVLEQMNRCPWRCQWCGGGLPPALRRQHARPHNHREEIGHHFHPECWKARLLAIAVIFAHVPPDKLLPAGRRRSIPKSAVEKAHSARRRRTKLTIVVEQIRRIIITRRSRCRA